jgi:diketogulonate reductase-like aldo/keto reductase
MYANEADVGRGIAESGLARAEVFVTSKVWVSNYARGRIGPSIDESLRQLGTDYVDLMLLHWPGSSVPLVEQLGGLNDAVRAGKIRHIGVSNYNRALLAEAIRLSDAPIVTNQVEYHPYLDQRLLLAAARQSGVSIMAYCAMAVGRVFGDAKLQEIARRHGRSVSQIVLRWLIQQEDVLALSRTSNPSRLAENVAIFDFELAADDMAAIFALARPGSRIVDPPQLAPAWD